MTAHETTGDLKPAARQPNPATEHPSPSAGPNDLLERYVREVGRHLPKTERADVEAELRSLLDEMLAERAASMPGQATEDLTVAVLREFGRPELVAERYGQPRRSLVGPGYYPAYVLVLKIVLGLVTVVYVASLALWIGFGGPASTHMLDALSGGEGDLVSRDVLRALWQTALGYVGTILTNVGLITAIFAALERFAPASAADQEDWDPRELPRTLDPDRLDRGDLIFEVCMLVGLLVFFNAVVRWQGPAIYWNNGSLTVLGRFTPELLALVPWLNALWISELALNLFVLGRGRWNPSTRLLDIGINVATLIVLAVILGLPAIVDIAGLSALVKLGLVVVWVLVAIELAQHVRRFLSSRAARVAEAP